MHEYSSFSFWFVCAYAQGTWLSPAFGLLFGISILNHTKPDGPAKRWIQRVDRLLAHAITLGTVIDAWHVPRTPARVPSLYLYQFCLCYTVWVYKIARYSFLPAPTGKLWHASVHMLSSLGSMALYHAKTRLTNGA